MRIASLAALIVLAGFGFAEDKIKPRFGIDGDTDTYSQRTPKDTLRSVLKAIDAKRVNYLLAHLAEPTFVDQRVKDLGGKFEDMVKETAQKLEADPESLRELRKFLTDGEWKEEGETATATCKEVRGKTVHFKKIGGRWFFENRIRAAKS